MNLETKVKQILNDLNIKISQKGYTYWVDAVKYVIENDITFYSMTKEIYPKIAEKYNDVAHRVERALRHAHENKNEAIQAYFGVTYKIDNSALLALIVDKIKIEMSEK